MARFIVVVVTLVVIYMSLIMKPSNTQIQQAAAEIVAQHKEPVVFYSAEWCGYCRATRQLLDEKKIPYKEYDIETSSEGKAQYDKLNGSGVPLLLVKGELIRGYDERSILNHFK